MTMDANIVTSSAKFQGPHVSSTLIRATLAYVSLLGYEARSLMDQVALPTDIVSDPDGQVPEIYYDRLLHLASEMSQDPFFGLRLGAGHGVRHMGVLGFLVMNAATVREALLAYERFQAALGESMAMTVEEREALCVITISCHGGELSGRHRVESFVSSLQAAVQELTGRKLIYSRVMLRESVPDVDGTYESILGITPERTDRNRVEFPSSFLDEKVLHAVPELNFFFETKLKEILSIRSNQDLSSRIKREMMKRFGSSKPITLQEFAKSLAMSTRSLQLKLQDEGTNFKSVHDDVQKEFALSFLKEGRPIAEISYALGFSEPSAFQRAFKRWTGEAPAQFRSRL